MLCVFSIFVITVGFSLIEVLLFLKQKNTSAFANFLKLSIVTYTVFPLTVAFPLLVEVSNFPAYKYGSYIFNVSPSIPTNTIKCPP